MKLLLKTFIVMLFLFLANSLYANEPIKNKIDSLDECIVTLKDGSALIGKIISSNSVEIKLQTISGIITINQSNIVSIVLKKNSIKYNNYNQNYNQNYNSTNERFGNYEKPPSIEVNHKYFWTNNYMGIKKNEFYFQNIWVLYNGLDYGISDNFSIGGGLLFAGIVGFVNIHFRSQVEVAENFNVGVAYNYFVATSIYNNFSLNSSSEKIGFLSGGFTYGNEKANISLGVGRFNSNEESLLNNKNELGFSVSGSVKISTNTSIVSDNLIWSNELNLYCLGFRLNSSKSCKDFGLMNFRTFNSYGSNSTFIPYIALNYKIK